MLAIFFALITAATTMVSGHYVLSELVVDGTPSAEWQFVRQTQNDATGGSPLVDVNSPLMRCFENDTAAATSVANISAGATVGFKANVTFFHKGFFTAYMTEADPVNSEDAGAGQTWFKIFELGPTFTPGADGQSGNLSFPGLDTDTFNMTIPPSLPSGNYLLRGEHVGLDVATAPGGAQFYIGCAQVNVANSGNGFVDGQQRPSTAPGPLVSIPGVYTDSDPGLIIDINNLPSNFTGYTVPGPAVWNQ